MLRPLRARPEGGLNLESSPKDPTAGRLQADRADSNDSSSCPKHRCSRATTTAAVSYDATQTVDERNRDVEHWPTSVERFAPARSAQGCSLLCVSNRESPVP
jgi:hypothetical protein